MRMENEGKVIKPPIEIVISGKIFRPSKALRNKNIIQMLIVAIVLWAVTVLSWMGFVYLIEVLDHGWTMTEYWTVINSWWVPVNYGVWIFNAIWLLPGLVLVPLYIRAMEYSVIAESGKTMPEVYVKKGIINITRKHVPFRTITNISSTSGPFDRLFGIGNVLIETAGFSGSMMGPEEKIEGVRFYEEVRDFILNELRKFRDPYVTATEVVLPREEPVPRMADSLDDEMLITLREIRDVMRKLERKLGDGGQ